MPVAITEIPPEGTRQIKTYIDNEQILDPVGAGVTFTSNDSSIATVSRTGVITAVGEGTTSIIVKLGDSTATVRVTVRP